MIVTPVQGMLRLESVDFQRRAGRSASAFSALPLPAREITTFKATTERRYRGDVPAGAAEAEDTEDGAHDES